MDQLNMIQESKYGSLLRQDAKIFRNYFKEACSLIGITVIYRAPKPDKHWTMYAEIDSNYEAPIATRCIFEEHVDQQTLRKIGWVSELQENASFIHVNYDLPGLQQGALFIVPSGLDNAKGRLFRVVGMSNSIIYPSSITCEIVPEYENEYEPALNTYANSSFNLLYEEEDHM